MIYQTHTLTLNKLTVTQGASGSQSKTWSTVQTLTGSLQPVRIMEGNLFDKQTVKADYVFYVEKSQFTSSSNESELKEMNQMIYGSQTFEIKGVINWSVNPYLTYYKVLLLEVK